MALPRQVEYLHSAPLTLRPDRSRHSVETVSIAALGFGAPDGVLCVIEAQESQITILSKCDILGQRCS